MAKDKEVREPLEVTASCDGGSMNLKITSSKFFLTDIEIETDNYESKSQHLFWPGRVVEFTIPMSNTKDKDYDVSITYTYKKNEIEVQRTVTCKGVTPPPDSTEIPEFPTIALPVAAVIVIVFFLQRKKQN